MKTQVTANQKGGVGKSTVTAHLAYAAVAQKKRVLLVDLDPSGNLSLTFANPERDSMPTLKASELFWETASANAPEKISKYLSIIAADLPLRDILQADNSVLKIPRHWLQKMSAEYDLCLIDTPPSLSTLLVAALVAADFVLTPMQVGLYEMAGVADLLNTIKGVKRNLNTKLHHSGILLVKTNTRSKEEQEALASLRAQYGNAILSGSLPERAAVRAAVAKKIPVWESPRGSSHTQAASEWRTVCNQIITGVLK